MCPASVSGTVVRDGAQSRCVAYTSAFRDCSLFPHPAAHTESQRHPRWRAGRPTRWQWNDHCLFRGRRLV